MSAPSEVIAALHGAWENDLLRQRKPKAQGSAIWQPGNCWASSRRLCTRAMALDMLHPEDKEDFGPETLELFEQGNEAESAVMARLGRIGPFASPPFRVVQQQHRFELKDRDGTVLITGKMDGKIQFSNSGPKIPVEVKSGRTYDGCKSVDDLDRGVWSRSAVDQLLAYLLGAGDPWGVILIRRGHAFPSWVPVVLEEHLQRAEAFLQQARQAVDARHGRSELPPFIENSGECRRCSHFGKSCSPPLDYGPGLKVIADENLLHLAEVREANESAFHEFRRADEALKDALRGVENGSLGPFQVTGKWKPRTDYKVPDDIRKQYAVQNEKGAFTLKIERVQ